MINQNIKEILRQARDYAKTLNVKVHFMYHYEKSHLMRIGNNSVSLNTSEELTRLDIYVLDGKKSGSHTQLGDITSLEYVKEAVNIAVDKAKLSKPKDYQPLTFEIEDNFDETMQVDDTIINLNSKFKADNYMKIIESVGEEYNYSGSWSSGCTEVFIISTEGNNEAFNRTTDYLFNVVLKHPEKKWEISESQTGYELSHFDIDKAIYNLKSLVNIYENNEGKQIKSGKYTVMFGKQAIAELLMMAVWTGFEGMGFEEKRSWLAQNKFGDKILSEKISIIDDPRNDDTFRSFFDLNGKKRDKFELISNGIFKNILYSSKAAAKFDKSPTGHDTMRLSISLQPGNDGSDPIAETKGMGKVLYIPALHYINLPNPSQGIFTGSSRFNALLVEDGKIISPIFSSRVTDCFQQVFGNVKKLSSSTESVNLSNSYSRRSPFGFSVPKFIISGDVKITDCAESF